MSENYNNNKTIERVNGKLFLKIILAKLNKTAINDITEFVNIDRDDLIKNTFDELFTDELNEELFKFYKKKEIGWYQRKTIDNYS